MYDGVEDWTRIQEYFECLAVYEWKNLHKKLLTQPLYPRCPAPRIPICFMDECDNLRGTLPHPVAVCIGFRHQWRHRPNRILVFTILFYDAQMTVLGFPKFLFPLGPLVSFGILLVASTSPLSRRLDILQTSIRSLWLAH